MRLTKNMSFPLDLGEPNTVLELFDEGANIHSAARQRRPGVMTLLHVASRHGHHTRCLFKG